MSSVTRIVLHGGAGVTPGRDYHRVERHLLALATACAALLADGMSALDTVERAVRDMEESGMYVAGRGSAPNAAGPVELDASIMDGARFRAGGVCAARDLRNPVSAARLVLERSDHVLLAGEGAVAFALAQGEQQIVDPAHYYVVPEGVELNELSGVETLHGTVGAVALDRDGRLAAATSTGGLFGKAAGRVGDTGIAGLGTWADDAVAVSCTGIGEAFMLAGGAGDVAARMRYGAASLDDAAAALLARVAALGGDGGLIAVDARGHIAMPFNSGGLKRAWAGNGLTPGVAIT